MAEKDEVYPLAPINHPRSDEESAATLKPEDIRRKRNAKCLVYILAGVVFLTMIILVLGITVFRIESPDLKFNSVMVNNFKNGTAASPSLSMTLIAQVSINNKNFGEFRFDNSTTSVSYRGMMIGEGPILPGRAKARRTHRMNITIDVSSKRLSNDTMLSSDIKSGNLTLSGHTRLSGKVNLMKVMKKSRTTELYCNMTLILKTGAIQDLMCE